MNDLEEKIREGVMNLPPYIRIIKVEKKMENFNNRIMIRFNPVHQSYRNKKYAKYRKIYNWQNDDSDTL